MHSGENVVHILNCDHFLGLGICGLSFLVTLGRGRELQLPLRHVTARVSRPHSAVQYEVHL